MLTNKVTITLSELDSICAFVNQIEEEFECVHSISINTIDTEIGKRVMVSVQTSPDTDEGVYKDVSDLISW